MEDEKKKKRNKKKKNNKQTKTTTEVAAAGGVAADQNHVTNGQHDDLHHPNQVSEKAEIQNGQVDPDDNGHHQSNGTESVILAEAERQHLLQREATLEEKIKQLQNESDSHKQKVATLEKTIKQLRDENDLHMQKEATLEETIKQLRIENDAHIQKEASLEEKIKLLVADKCSWIQSEGISKETISSLNIDITWLRMQVVELEESQNNLLQENQQLKENVASLQLQLSSDEIKKGNLEPEEFDSQIEAAFALVDKLITENVELVEKVNELSVKLDQQTAASGLSSTIGSDPVITIISNTETLSESSGSGSSFNHKLENLEVITKEERNGVNHVHSEPTALIMNSSEAYNSGEIVQIPLHDIEVEDLESQVVENNDEADVPLTDAPLIGAPFRLVSFVANYVSGADLVNKSSSNSRS